MKALYGFHDNIMLLRLKFSLTVLLVLDHYCGLHRGLVAQWITRLPTEQKIPGSSPGKIETFNKITNPLLI